MAHARAEAQAAGDDLAACRELAGAIEKLRDQPAIAAANAMGTQELGQRIEAAARQAEISPAALEGVFPQTARRVGDSLYLSKPTTLTLRGVALPPLATFLFNLTNESGLMVRDLRLHAPRDESGTGLWDAEATVTALVYAPPVMKGRQP